MRQTFWLKIFETLVEEAFNLAKRQASIIDTIIIFGSFVTVTAALPLVQTNARVQ